MPGTFYRQATPQSAPYVEIGTAVTSDTVVGLIEVMKPFSEVTAGSAGTLLAFAVQDGDPLEPGQVIAGLASL